MKLLEKGKKIVKKHKKAIIGGIVIGVTAYVVLKDSRALSEHEKEGKEILNTLLKLPTRSMTAASRQIDEEIFTELAPDIEELVLNKGIENALSEKYFDLGEDRLFKHVEVKITQYAGD